MDKVSEVFRQNKAQSFMTFLFNTEKLEQLQIQKNEYKTK